MKITRAEFVVSAASPRQFPREGLPEIAFVGRSNVGKSSLLNSLTRRKNLAKVSQTPGKTRLITFYRIDNRCFFVDLPGYGFARVPKAVKEQWASLLEGYLQNREELCGVVQLVDLRHLPTAADCQMFAWLQHYGIPVLVVGTKADKVSRGRRREQERQIARTLGLPPDVPLVSHSAKTGEGREEVLQLLAKWVSPAGT
ncbi:MAG TPA: YihA family ribosome biogenesis GTP-binding protein [Firmicutes bacterium]|nr:YihA family ribosome biogenesis GTP-binding protein [Bacillota bacterium]